VINGERTGGTMKKKPFLQGVFLFFLLLWPMVTLASGYGQIRALEQRAAEVTELKNRFLSQVLDSYRVPYEKNQEGMVVRIQVENRWYRIQTVEIVPVTSPDGKDPAVTGHEIFFYTDGGIFHIVTPLTAR